MDDTINLRPYGDALVQRWWVILGVVVLGVLIAALLHFSTTDYRATALVAAVDEARRQQSVEIANSDQVLSTVLAQTKMATSGVIATAADLRERLDINTPPDSKLLRFSAKHNDPLIAAEIANLWAQATIDAMEEIYLEQDSETALLEEELAAANIELQETEQALIDFQAVSRLNIIENQISSLSIIQTTQLVEQQRLNSLLGAIQVLKDQIAVGTGATLTVAEQLAALSLQQQAFARLTPIGAIQYSSVPTQSQADPATGDRLTQLALLEDIAELTDGRLASIELELSALEPRFFTLQQEKQTFVNRLNTLEQEQKSATATTEALIKDIDSLRKQSQAANNLQIISPALPPEGPERSNLPVTAGIAGVAGLLISTAAIILFTWWKETDHTRGSALPSDHSLSISNDSSRES